jgi:hypothetical protein
MRDGSVVDIYGAVLAAIASSGPKTELTYEEIRTNLRLGLRDDPPASHEVTRVLDKMAEIAKAEELGEPVLDWDAELRVLHITDPFFAYYLRWGVAHT